MSKITYQYRIYPYGDQALIIENWFELCRKQYNYRLAEKRDAYKQDKTSISALDQQKNLQNTKKLFPEYREIPSHVLQDVIFRVDKAFQNFFRRCKEKKSGSKVKAGFPRFKGKGRYASITCPDFYPYVKDGKFHFPRLSPIRIVLHRPLPSDAVIKTCTISKKIDAWYVSFSFEATSIQEKYSGKKELGIDVGLEHFLVTSDGDMVDNPRNLRKSLRKLRGAQHSLSRKRKGSKNRKKQANKVAKLHFQIAKRRNNFHWKVIKNLILICCFIAVEKLNVKGMVKNHRLAQSISDASWSSFILKLKFKAASAGVRVVEVNPRNTSQICSGCGAIVQKELQDRWHLCPECGLSLQRDHNAAKNILKLGQDMPDSKPVERTTSAFRFRRKVSGLKETGTVLGDSI